MLFHTSLSFASDFFYFHLLRPGTFAASTDINSNGSVKQCGCAILGVWLGANFLHELGVYSCLRKECGARLMYYRLERLFFYSLLAFSGPIPTQPSS